MIVNSNKVRDALKYNGTDAREPFDPSDPMTYMWNCVYPFLKDPDSITTADPQVLVGVNTVTNAVDSRLINCCVTIYVVINNDDMKTDSAYIREDLLADGIVNITKADLVTDAILEALTSEDSKTWIGDIYDISTSELSLNNAVHYARRITLYTKEVNLFDRGI